MTTKTLLAGALALVLATAPALAQSNPGTSPLSIAKGGTAAGTASGARSNLGLAIGSDVQQFDSDLAALAANTGTGLWARTGSGTGAVRTLTSPAAGISIANGDGVSGNPTLSLANDLAALEGLSGNGCAGRTGTDTWALRTITGTANKITVTNGDCVSGNPTLTIPASPALDGVVNFTGARKDSTQSTPAQITANQNDYNPSSVVCASSGTLIINSDAARDITGIAGGVAGCDLFLFNNGNFPITLKDGSVSSSAANRFAFGADFPLASKAAVYLKYDGNGSVWRNTTGSGTGGGGAGVTSIGLSNTYGLNVSGSPVTTSGNISAGVALTTATHTMTSDTTLTAGNYFAGPSMPQGSSGTWLAMGTVTLTSTATNQFYCRMTDGSTVQASLSSRFVASGSSAFAVVSLSGIFTNPAGNIRIECREDSGASKIVFNASGQSKDSRINGVRLQ